MIVPPFLSMILYLSIILHSVSQSNDTTVGGQISQPPYRHLEPPSPQNVNVICMFKAWP